MAYINGNKIVFSPVLNIGETPEDIEALQQQIDALKIINEKEGKNIAIFDAANIPAENIILYGRTEQAAIPTKYEPQNLNTLGTDGDIKINILSKNLFDTEKFVELVKMYDTNATEIVVDGRNCIKFNIFKLYKKDFSEVFKFNKKAQYTWSMDVKFAEKFTGKADDYNCPLIFGFLYNGEDVTATNISSTDYGVPLINRRTTVYKDNYLNSFGKVSVTSSTVAEFSGIAFSYNDQGYWYIDLDTIQIEEGASVTEYEHYNEKIITVPTENGLPGVPVSLAGNYTDENGQQWICDEIDLARGVYIKNIEEITVPKIENYIIRNDSSQTENIYAFFNVSNVKSNGALLTNAQYSGNNFPNATEFFGLNEKTDGNVEVTFCVGLPFDDDEMNAIEVQSFSTNYEGQKMLLIKNTPIETPLPEEVIKEFANTYMNKPVTNIYNDENAHMYVKYIADTKAYIDNKFEQIASVIANSPALIMEG